MSPWAVFFSDVSATDVLKRTLSARLDQVAGYNQVSLTIIGGFAIAALGLWGRALALAQKPPTTHSRIIQS
jgi:hypothetical protein